MSSNYCFDKTFTKVNFSVENLVFNEFEQCIFSKCELNNVDLSDIKFINCSFIDCNLSNVKLINTSLQEVEFERCKMIGFNMDEINQFGLKVSFTECNLNESSFYEAPLKKYKIL